MMVLSILTDFCSWWPIWWILPFILGWLLGRMMMMKWKTRTEELEKEVSNWKSKYKSLEEDLAECRKLRAEAESSLALERGRYKELDAKFGGLTTSMAALQSDYDGSASEIEKAKADAAARTKLQMRAKLQPSEHHHLLPVQESQL